jgi:signal transduction histidine kinase
VTAGPGPATAFEGALWRALGVFRIASLLYASGWVVLGSREYAHRVAAWLVVGVMAGWTAFALYAYARPELRRWPLQAADLAVSLVLVLASGPIVGAVAFQHGAPIIPVTWHATPVLVWAVARGRRLGLLAAALIAVADLLVRLHVGISAALTGTALLLLAGFTVGHYARLLVDAQQRLQAAVEREAASRERDRLARGIHDSVLQVLALVQRRGAELGGEAAELGRLAGEQEAALRMLVTAGPVATGSGPVDLSAELGRYLAPDVTVATPAQPVLLPRRTVLAVAAAVGAALDNARQHGGPTVHAWLLVEEEPATITITVRDDGPGFPPGRLARAATEGRLGVTQSIRGRIAELGGSVDIASRPGEGVEVELRVPRT